MYQQVNHRTHTDYTQWWLFTPNILQCEIHFKKWPYIQTYVHSKLHHFTDNKYDRASSNGRLMYKRKLHNSSGQWASFLRKLFLRFLIIETCCPYPLDLIRANFFASPVMQLCFGMQLWTGIPRDTIGRFRVGALIIRLLLTYYTWEFRYDASWDIGQH